jgi:antitoxin component YwqK of YwqJK toxin-antitoxin module
MKRLVLAIMLIFVLALVEGCGKKEKAEAPPMGEPEKMESFYPDGQRSLEGQYIDGKMNGAWRAWYENGQLQQEENYVDNLMEGKQSYWYKRGKIRKESWYKAGKLHGKESMWDGEGNLLSLVEYENGVAVTP